MSGRHRGNVIRHHAAMDHRFGMDEFSFSSSSFSFEFALAFEFVWSYRSADDATDVRI
jgi:hypothetical protein